LRIGNLYRSALKADNSNAGDVVPKLLKWYGEVLLRGLNGQNKEEKALAANNLAVLRLDKRNEKEYSPQKAVDLFREHVFVGGLAPDVPDRFAYHYNFGR